MDKTSVFYTRRRMPPSLSSLGSFSISSVYFESSLLLYHTMLKGESVSSPSISLIFTRQFSFPQKPSSHGSSATNLKEMKVESVRELGKESGSEDVSVARLQHNKV